MFDFLFFEAVIVNAVSVRALTLATQNIVRNRREKCIQFFHIPVYFTLAPVNIDETARAFHRIFLRRIECIIYGIAPREPSEAFVAVCRRNVHLQSDFPLRHMLSVYPRPPLPRLHIIIKFVAVLLLFQGKIRVQLVERHVYRSRHAFPETFERIFIRRNKIEAVF